MLPSLGLLPVKRGLGRVEGKEPRKRKGEVTSSDRAVTISDSGIPVQAQATVPATRR